MKWLKRKRRLELFLIVVLMDVVSLNVHHILPQSEYEVCYDANRDRFYNLSQSLMITGLIAVIALQSVGYMKVIAWSWFLFGIAHFIDELFFNNFGGYWLEWVVFVIIAITTGVEVRRKAHRSAGKSSAK